MGPEWKEGLGDFHSQRPDYIAFTFKVVVGTVCWEAEEQLRGRQNKAAVGWSPTREQIYSSLPELRG